MSNKAPWSRRAQPSIVIASLYCIAATTVFIPQAARPAEVRFSGSVQLDYLAVPTTSIGRDFSFDGFTTEVSLKASVEFNDWISASVKTCYGCHGFEMAAAYVDLQPLDALKIRAGRLSPTFGDFPTRYDPANHLTNDKPLPYDMGRMLRLREWNMSVLPAPYVDNGAEVSVRASPSELMDLDFHAYVIGGFKGSNNAFDVDFIQSRSSELYYIDNNSRPTVGGRVALSLYPGDTTLKLGASGMWGTFTPNNSQDILILGADLVLRIENWTLRAEYLVRRTEMFVGENPEQDYQYGPNAEGKWDPYALKHGWYVETDFPLGESLEMIGRFDGMYRVGNVPKGGALRSESMVLRYTLGTNWRFARDWRIKFSGEFYDFSDFDDEVALHLGVVGAF